MQDEASGATPANAPSPPPPPQGMGSDDATASSHGFSAHSEAPPDRSGFEDIEDRYQPQHRSEISSRPSFERQKLTAEQAAANGDMQNSASLRICRTCNASFHSRNALMRHVTDRKHHERKGVQGQGAKKRRRDRREPKQRADRREREARSSAAAPPPQPMRLARGGHSETCARTSDCGPVR